MAGFIVSMHNAAALGEDVKRPLFGFGNVHVG